jgi:hypothetical protein
MRSLANVRMIDNQQVIVPRQLGKLGITEVLKGTLRPIHLDPGLLSINSAGCM